MNKEFLQRDSAYLNRTKRARNIRLAILAIAYLPESIITRVEFNFHTRCWRFDHFENRFLCSFRTGGRSD